MARLFGTDGVRGLANARPHRRARARPVGRRRARARRGGRLRRPPARRRRRPRPARVGRVPRGRRRRRAWRRAGVDVLRRRGAAHPGRRLPHRRRSAPTSASCSRRRTTRCRTTASSSSPAAATSSPTSSRTPSRRGCGEAWQRPTGAGVGRVATAAPTARERYVAHLLVGAAAPARRPARRRRRRARRGVAASRPTALRAGRRPRHRDRRRARRPQHQRRLRLHPPGERCRRAVVEHGADLGIALDGDADRCLAVDATGEDVDGDQIMAVLALAMRERGRLRRATPLVATVMCNLGHAAGACEREGIDVRRRRRSATATCWRR